MPWPPPEMTMFSYAVGEGTHLRYSQLPECLDSLPASARISRIAIEKTVLLAPQLDGPERDAQFLSKVAENYQALERGGYVYNCPPAVSRKFVKAINDILDFWSRFSLNPPELWDATVANFDYIEGFSDASYAITHPIEVEEHRILSEIATFYNGTPEKLAYAGLVTMLDQLEAAHFGST